MDTQTHQPVSPSRAAAKYVLDGNANNVRYLIYHGSHPVNGEVLVFIDDDLDLDWECDDKADVFTDTAPLNTVVRKVLNGVAALESIMQNWPCDLKLTAKRLLGEAIASVLVGDEAAANEALSNAKQFATAKSKQVSRFWILKICIISGTCAGMLGISEVILRSWIEPITGVVGFQLSLCFLAGCVGALLFVIMRLGKQPHVDSTAERQLHYIEGLSRIVAGGIAGSLVGGTVKLGLILPVLCHTGMETLSMCIAAMIAGASERMAAGVVTKVVKNEQSEMEN